MVTDTHILKNHEGLIIKYLFVVLQYDKGRQADLYNIKWNILLFAHFVTVNQTFDSFFLSTCSKI